MKALFALVLALVSFSTVADDLTCCPMHRPLKDGSAECPKRPLFADDSLSSAEGRRPLITAAFLDDCSTCGMSPVRRPL